MALLLTEDALFCCKHRRGTARAAPSQSLLTVAGRRVLVRSDPEGRPIRGCVIPPPQKPCTSTINVLQGYSTWITVAGRPVCASSLQGFTDGSPPGVSRYEVRAPGQGFVSAELP